MRAFTAFALIVLLHTFSLENASAQELAPLPDADGIRKVIAVGPSWKSFTNEDGTGLYHEILNKVFALYHITVQRQYVPSERGLQLIANGEADFQTCYDSIPLPYVLAKVPMYENAYYVFFNKQRIGAWQGNDSLRGRKIVCRIGYYSENNFKVPVLLHKVKTGTAALAMVLLGRMDFYVDDLKLIQESIAKSEIKFDHDAYATEKIGSRAYFPVFAETKRSAKVMELYEAGMRRLHETNELEAIYRKWGHPYPQFDKY